MKTTPDTRPLAERITQGPANVQPDHDAGVHHDGGRWVRLNGLFSVRVIGGEFMSRHQPRVEDEERDANAELIAEAFNVTHETGRTPRQLAEERAELIAVLHRLDGYIRHELGHKGYRPVWLNELLTRLQS